MVCEHWGLDLDGAVLSLPQICVRERLVMCRDLSVSREYPAHPRTHAHTEILRQVQAVQQEATAQLRDTLLAEFARLGKDRAASPTGSLAANGQESARNHVPTEGSGGERVQGQVGVDGQRHDGRRGGGEGGGGQEQSRGLLADTAAARQESFAPKLELSRRSGVTLPIRGTCKHGWMGLWVVER